MIKITKGDAPEDLTNAGVELTKKLKTDFDASPNDYINGVKKFGFTDAYRSAAVKTALRKAQHNKCCFSEAKFVGDDSHVEHFRPKGKVQIYQKGSSTYPGYYWLAYDWSNLLLCKSTINSSAKRNFFPLEDETQRNKKHNDAFTEMPLLIDPSVDDPKDHIEFKGDEPVGKTKRGQLTITLLRLRSSELEEARRKKLQLIEGLRDLVNLLIANGISINDATVQSSIDKLRSTTKVDAEFSSMSTDFLSGWPPLA